MTEPQLASKRRLGLLTMLAVVVLVAVLAGGYFRLGWDRMESHCDLDDRDAESVSYSWTWQPLGFTCRYDGGDTETSLWF